MEELCKNILDNFEEKDVAEIVISIEKNKFIVGLLLMDKVIVETLAYSTVLEGLKVLSEFIDTEMIK